MQTAKGVKTPQVRLHPKTVVICKQITVAESPLLFYVRIIKIRHRRLGEFVFVYVAETWLLSCVDISKHSYSPQL